MSPTSPAQWTGIFPAALTMFSRDGRLDVSASAAHVSDLIDQGAHGIVIAGTSGEFIALEDTERRQLIEAGVAAAAGRVPVIVGTGTYTTAGSVALTRHAADVGADGAIVILPYYQRPSPEEVLAHFRTIAKRTSIPLMAYNNPANSAAPALTTQHLAALYSEKVIAGVKSTFPTVHQVHEARAATDEGFRVFYGSFMAPLEGLAGGAHGWISGILNVSTADARQMFDAIRRGDLAAAHAAWRRILPIKQLYTESQLGGGISDLVIYRAILELRGKHGGWSRAPLLPLSDPQRDVLKRLLA